MNFPCLLIWYCNEKGGSALERLSFEVEQESMSDGKLLQYKWGECQAVGDKDYRETPACSQGGGGCPYLLPIGGCAKNTPNGESYGCSLSAAAWAQRQIEPLALAGLGLAIIDSFGIVIGFCLCCKRKDHDVLPTKYIQGKNKASGETQSLDI